MSAGECRAAVDLGTENASTAAGAAAAPDSQESYRVAMLSLERV